MKEVCKDSMNSKGTKKGRTHFPNPARLIQALSQIGYRFEDAIADLIDNSITAGASEIMIRFFHDGEQLVSIAIADNGIGMSEKKLINFSHAPLGSASPPTKFRSVLTSTPNNKLNS